MQSCHRRPAFLENLGLIVGPNETMTMTDYMPLFVNYWL